MVTADGGICSSPNPLHNSQSIPPVELPDSHHFVYQREWMVDNAVFNQTCDLSQVPIMLSCFHATSIHHFQKSTGTYRIIPGHHLVAVNVLCSISTPLHKLHPLPISLACTKHSSHVENTLFKYQWI